MREGGPGHRPGFPACGRRLHRSITLLWCFLGLLFGAKAQTVVINEASNGPAGSQEYVELVVVPDGPFDPCAPPPCLDLRGWIFDDNNGYHGTGGAAPGAMRFRDHALWSCVPIGTLIVLYNDADPNGAIPANDVSLTDGNCRIIIGANDLTYFEYTPNTPAAVACDDPGGWGTDSSPTWLSNLALANGGDCARVCSPDGCEVFSLCYGGLSANAMVYFAGNGGQRAWSFGGGDPYNVGNWSFGNVNSGAQTPGSPNNAANAAWIATLNNNCTPQNSQPLTAVATGGPGCGCTASAEVSATGSSGVHEQAWYDAGWAPLGITTAQAEDLCAGTYHVIVTSSTGCIDTATVDLTMVPPPDGGTDESITLCPGDDLVDLFELLGGTPDVSGSWTPVLSLGTGLFDPALDAPGTYTYTVSGQAPCTDASATVTVTMAAPTVAQLQATDPDCASSDNGSIEVVPNDLDGYQWADGPSGPTRTDLAPGTYTVEVTDDGSCPTTLEVTLQAPAPLVVDLVAQNAVCGQSNGGLCATASGGTAPWTIDWGAPSSNGCLQGLSSGSYQVTVTDAQGCIATATGQVANMPGNIALTVSDEDVSCHGAADGSATVVLVGNATGSWTGPDGAARTGLDVEDLAPGTWQYEVVDAEQCLHTGSITIAEPLPLQLTETHSDETCIGSCDGSVQLAATGGTGPFTFQVNDQPLSTSIATGLCPGPQTLLVRDAHGCTTDLSTTVQPGSGGEAAVIAPLPALCVNEEPVVLEATPIGGLWSGPGIVDPELGLFDPSVAGPGTAHITYTNVTGCASDDQGSLLVSAVPEASFTVNAGPVWTFRTNGSHSDLVYWLLDGEVIGEGNTWSYDPGRDTDPKWICAVVVNTAGCADTTCQWMQLVRDPEVYIPNAFTPNGDGHNDRFGPSFSAQVPPGALLRVHDRWGKVLFEGPPATGWDGQGPETPIGVYIWTVTYREPTDGDEQRLTGHVTLVR